MDFGWLDTLGSDWWMVIVTAAAAFASFAVAVAAWHSSRRATTIADQALRLEIDAQHRARELAFAEERNRVARLMMGGVKAMESWYTAKDQHPDEVRSLRFRSTQKVEQAKTELRFITDSDDVQLHAWYAMQIGELDRLACAVLPDGSGMMKANHLASTIESDIERWAGRKVTGAQLFDPEGKNSFTPTRDTA